MLFLKVGHWEMKKYHVNKMVHEYGSMIDVFKSNMALSYDVQIYSHTILGGGSVVE